MPSSVYSCVHAHLPRVQWAGRRWASRSFTYKGRDICVLSGPGTDTAVGSPTDPLNDLLHVRRGLGPFNCGNVMRTICISLTRRLGPPCWTMSCSRGSRTSSGRGYPAPRPIV